MEIRVEIAAYLSTVDVFNLPYTSRAMALLFQLQSFWKTRFRVNGDHGFLACLAEAPQSRKRKNWRSIYHCTARVDQPHLQLWTLRRIWRTNQWLADRCSMVEDLDDQPRSHNNCLVEYPGRRLLLRCDAIELPNMGKITVHDKAALHITMSLSKLFRCKALSAWPCLFYLKERRRILLDFIR